MAQRLARLAGGLRSPSPALVETEEGQGTFSGGNKQNAGDNRWSRASDRVTAALEASCRAQTIP